MSIELKAGRVEIKSTNDDEGIVEAFVNLMGETDHVDDVMTDGVFDRSISRKSKMPKLELPDHGPHDPVRTGYTGITGRVLETHQEGDNQYIKARFNTKTQAGHDAYELVKAGDLPEWSVSWTTLKSHFEKKDNRRVRFIDEIDWHGVAPCDDGVSYGTKTLSVKAGNADNLICPFCHPKADPGSDDKADCTCKKDCGEDGCPMASETKALSHNLGLKAIAEKEGAPKSAPKGYPTDSSKYGDPKNFEYPIDQAHVASAVGYFNHSGAQKKGGYSDTEWAEIGGRIAAAANKLIGDGHSFKDGAIETEDSKDDKESKTSLSMLEIKWFSHMEGSYEDLIDDLNRLIAMSLGTNPYPGYDIPYIAVLATFDGYCICEVPEPEGKDSTYFKVEYTIGADGEPSLGVMTPVDMTFTESTVETASRRIAPSTWGKLHALGTKAGKRNSAGDADHLQQAHDHIIATATANDVKCDPDHCPRCSPASVDTKALDRARWLRLRTITGERPTELAAAQ
jgi:HK97 family phage prohead protease